MASIAYQRTARTFFNAFPAVRLLTVGTRLESRAGWALLAINGRTRPRAIVFAVLAQQVETHTTRVQDDGMRGRNCRQRRQTRMTVPTRFTMHAVPLEMKKTLLLDFQAVVMPTSGAFLRASFHVVFDAAH